MVGRKWVGHLHSQICCEIKNYFDGAQGKGCDFFNIPIGTRKGGSCCVYGWVGDDLKSVSRNKVPPEIGLSQMPTLTESCPSVECQFPQCQVSIPNWPHFFVHLSFFFSFSYCTHEETNKSRVFQGLMSISVVDCVFCVLETF